MTRTWFSFQNLNVVSMRIKFTISFLVSTEFSAEHTGKILNSLDPTTISSLLAVWGKQVQCCVTSAGLGTTHGAWQLVEEMSLQKHSCFLTSAIKSNINPGAF